MHITDWFSASWVDLLGQKSKSIVTDGLIGHFDPSDTDSFDPSVAIGKDESYAGTFNNLVAGGEDLTLYNGFLCFIFIKHNLCLPSIIILSLFSSI